MRNIIALSVLGLVGCGDGFGEAGSGDPWPSSDAEVVAEESQAASLRYVRAQLILAADDDGSRANNVDPVAFAEFLKSVTTSYAAAGVGVYFDPVTDVVRINDTSLNRDCNPDPEDPCLCPSTRAHQQEIARRYDGKLVYLFNKGDRMDSACNLAPRGFYFSGSAEELVFLSGSSVLLQKAVHETGHFFHLGHTFPGKTSTAAQIRTRIQNWVEGGRPRADGLRALDGDGLSDTPPDVEPPGFRDLAGVASSCATPPTVNIDVPFSDGTTQTYTLAPDKSNAMSYWDMRCGDPNWAFTLSPQQGARVNDALDNGNRANLLAPRDMYTAILEPGAPGATRATRWTRSDLQNRMQRELDAGNRLTEMKAYNRGDGVIRYIAVWAPGNTGQTYLLGATRAQIQERFRAEVTAGRHVYHVQAYREGGQVLFDVVWESGGRNAVWQFEATRDQVLAEQSTQAAASRRLIRLFKYDLTGAGDMRYIAIWHKQAAMAQTLLLGASLSAFTAAMNSELAAGRHIQNMQAYREAAGLRFDGIWEPGNRDQSTAFNWAHKDFVARIDRELAAGRSLSMLDVYDAGGGVLRYSGVFGAGDFGQVRVLAENLAPFSTRVDELIAEGYVPYLNTAIYGR